MLAALAPSLGCRVVPPEEGWSVPAAPRVGCVVLEDPPTGFLAVAGLRSLLVAVVDGALSVPAMPRSVVSVFEGESVVLDDGAWFSLLLGEVGLEELSPVP